MIEKDKFYDVKEAGYLLWMSSAAVKNKCHKWHIKSWNIWTEMRKIFRIEWKDLLSFLKTR